MTLERFSALAGLLFLTAAAGAAEPPTLVLNDTNEAPYTTPAGDGFVDLVAAEAFRRAGVGLKLVRLPAERALMNADSGLDDGALARIAGLDANYPNLVRVPEKLLDWTFCAFSRDAAIPGQWAAIRQHPTGFIRGWKIYERGMAGAEQVLTAEDSAQLFRMLQLDRVEVVLYECWMGQSLLARAGMRGISPLAPPLARKEMFIYLNKRHAALAPKLAAALRAIKAEGLYQRLYQAKVRPSVEARAR